MIPNRLFTKKRSLLLGTHLAALLGTSLLACSAVSGEEVQREVIETAAYPVSNTNPEPTATEPTATEPATAEPAPAIADTPVAEPLPLAPAATPVLAAPVVSAPEQAVEEKVDASSIEWIEKSRHYIGKKVQKVTRSVDDYLSRDYSNSINESYLRVRLGYVLEEGGHAFPNNGVRLKVDLPKTEEKWSVIFESDSDEFQSLEEQNNANKSNKQLTKSRNGSIGALRFLLNKGGNWKNDFDVGVKAPLPLNPFIRFNMKRRYQISKMWQARIKHSIYDFSQEGFGEHSQFFLERPLERPNWYFTNVVDMQWQDEGSILQFGETMSWTHIPNDRDRYVYSLGEYYQQHPSPYLTSYAITGSYRRCVHRDWLYAEITPQVTWSESRDFEGVASLTFGIEVFFTN